MIILRPSEAHRWWNCGASLDAQQHPDALPDLEIDAAREGTCAAWVVETIINGDASSVDDMMGETHKNGWLVDEDMCRHLEPFVDMLNEREKARAEVFRSVEIAPGVLLQGTLDAESWQRNGTQLRIDDLKYGYDVVDVKDNKQLICYATLKLAALSAEGAPMPEFVTLGIYQPRAIHRDGVYRKWVVTVDELRAWCGQLESIAANISNGVAVSGKHCNHCKAAANCQALTKSIYAMYEPIQDRVFLKPSGQQLADELTMLDTMQDMLKARRSAVRAEAEARIRAQKFVPGWTIEQKYGNRAWKFDAPVIQALTGVDPTDTVICTPAELERRGANKQIVASMTYNPPSKRELRKIDETDIGKMFEKG